MPLTPEQEQELEDLRKEKRLDELEREVGHLVPAAADSAPPAAPALEQLPPPGTPQLPLMAKPGTDVSLQMGVPPSPAERTLQAGGLLPAPTAVDYSNALALKPQAGPKQFVEQPVLRGETIRPLGEDPFQKPEAPPMTFGQKAGRVAEAAVMGPARVASGAMRAPLEMAKGLGETAGEVAGEMSAALLPPRSVSESPLVYARKHQYGQPNWLSETSRRADQAVGAIANVYRTQADLTPKLLELAAFAHPVTRTAMAISMLPEAGARVAAAETPEDIGRGLGETALATSMMKMPRMAAPPVDPVAPPTRLMEPMFDPRQRLPQGQKLLPPGTGAVGLEPIRLHEPLPEVEVGRYSLPREEQYNVIDTRDFGDLVRHPTWTVEGVPEPMPPPPGLVSEVGPGFKTVTVRKPGMHFKAPYRELPEQQPKVTEVPPPPPAPAPPTDVVARAGEAIEAIPEKVGEAMVAVPNRILQKREEMALPMRDLKVPERAPNILDKAFYKTTEGWLGEAGVAPEAISRVKRSRYEAGRVLDRLWGGQERMGVPHEAGEVLYRYVTKTATPQDVALVEGDPKLMTIAKNWMDYVREIREESLRPNTFIRLGGFRENYAPRRTHGLPERFWETVQKYEESGAPVHELSPDAKRFFQRRSKGKTQGPFNLFDAGEEHVRATQKEIYLSPFELQLNSFLDQRQGGKWFPGARRVLSEREIELVKEFMNEQIYRGATAQEKALRATPGISHALAAIDWTMRKFGGSGLDPKRPVSDLINSLDSVVATWVVNPVKGAISHGLGDYWTKQVEQGILYSPELGALPGTKQYLKGFARKYDSMRSEKPQFWAELQKRGIVSPDEWVHENYGFTSKLGRAVQAPLRIINMMDDASKAGLAEDTFNAAIKRGLTEEQAWQVTQDVVWKTNNYAGLEFRPPAYVTPIGQGAAFLNMARLNFANNLVRWVTEDPMGKEWWLRVGRNMGCTGAMALLGAAGVDAWKRIHMMPTGASGQLPQLAPLESPPWPIRDYQQLERTGDVRSALGVLPSPPMETITYRRPKR